MLSQHIPLLSPQDLQQKWDEVLSFVPQRDENLQTELVRQERHEELRMEFANLANEVGPWIEQQTEYLATLGLQATGSLEVRLEGWGSMLSGVSMLLKIV